MEKLGFTKMAIALFLFSVATVMIAPAQTFTPLLNFDSTNGAYPFHTSLLQGLDGNLYGTASSGGADPSPCRFAPGCGTLIQITPGGTLTGLFKFNSTDGEFPYAGLLQAPNGHLYGTANSGGANGGGTVFEITPRGALATLYSFCAQASCADGLSPEATLLQATNGIYGTTSNGGARGSGTIFAITPTGTLTTLHSFSGPDGSNPSFGALVQGTDGKFYGTTSSGGSSGFGVVFKMSSAGKLSLLHSFVGSDGEFPNGLVQATDGNFYGTTSSGGATGGGTFFSITPAGTLTTLYSFCPLGNPCPDGGSPGDGVVQATDGNFYGTTPSGGANGSGTIFSITPGGALTTLYSFATADARPYTVLLQATDGNFYGTTEQGGLLTCGGINAGCGTVFSLSVGLAPFVKTNPTFGGVGEKVNILGTDLTGATAVTFNGISATYSVVSSTYIQATVPAGATTGTVEVTTPSGTLESNVVFRVP
jgi:uncharacterized repeat protein (TIGR03803 family)